MVQVKSTFLDEPELYSLASADSNLKRTHFQRKRYRDEIVKLIGPSRPFNFWGKDHYMGRVNHLGNACVVNESALKQLRHSDSNEPLYVINFVADAWRDFVDEIQRQVDLNVLHQDIIIL